MQGLPQPDVNLHQQRYVRYRSWQEGEPACLFLMLSRLKQTVMITRYRPIHTDNAVLQLRSGPAGAEGSALHVRRKLDITAVLEWAALTGCSTAVRGVERRRQPRSRKPPESASIRGARANESPRPPSSMMLTLANVAA